MGRKKKEAPPPVSTVKDHCGICNAKFSKDLRKTRKFVVNLCAAAADVGLAASSTTPAENQTVDVHLAMAEILTWRYQKPFTGLTDESVGLCCTCGFIFAKLYTAVKLFENANVELSYMSKLVETTLSKDSKGTDTTIDIEEEELALAQASQIVEYYDDNDPDYDPGADLPPVRVRDNSNKEFRCEHCPAGFDKQSNLRRHLLLSHDCGDREKEFQCRVCGKEYYFGYLLKNHELIHGEQRPFVCSIEGCDASFKNKLGLHHHVKIKHRSTRPYKCRYCSKAFKERRNHRVHEQYVHVIPRGMKPYPCEYCGEKFRRLQSIPGHHLKKCRKHPIRYNNGGTGTNPSPQPTSRTEQEETVAAVQSIPGLEIEVAEEIEVEQQGLLVLHNPE